VALRAALEDDLRLLGSPPHLLQRVLPKTEGELLRLLAVEGLAKPTRARAYGFERRQARVAGRAEPRRRLRSRCAGTSLKSIRDAFRTLRMREYVAQKLLLTGPAVFR
jgi:hypothetical protein